MEFTFLLPCLNEEESVALCIREVRQGMTRLGLDGEILVADNGSTDRSPEIAASCGARVVRVAQRGYGAAVLGGIQAARGRFVIMGDCDGSYDLANPDLFVKALREGADLVVGDRFRGGIQPGAMPLSHRFGVPLLSLLGRLRFGTRVRDFHCGLRGFSREKVLALGLRCPGMEFSTEMIARFARSGGVIQQVPTPLRKDCRTGKSHLRTLRDGWRHLRFILFSDK